MIKNNILISQRDDTSLLAQFFYADESLNAVACELDSFDGRQEPERCTTLVNQLRHCQDKVLTICSQIMDELIPESRANRDFRVKFPDDVMQENLAGQLWFGAECLAAGSSIMNREAESSAMRPLARALTKSLDIVRNLLREHALKGHMNLKVFIGRACSSVNNESHNPFTPADSSSGFAILCQVGITIFVLILIRNKYNENLPTLLSIYFYFDVVLLILIFYALISFKKEFYKIYIIRLFEIIFVNIYWIRFVCFKLKNFVSKFV